MRMMMLFTRAIQLLHIYANEKVSEIIDDIAYDEYYEHRRFTHVYSANGNGDKDKPTKLLMHFKMACIT